LLEVLVAELASLRIRRKICAFLEQLPTGFRVEMGDVQSGVWVELCVDEGYPYRPPSSVRVYGWRQSPEMPLVPRFVEGVYVDPSLTWRPGDNLERLLDTMIATVKISRQVSSEDEPF
jgi:hypothetical protein